MPQHVIKQRLVVGIVLFDPAEEIFQRDPEGILDPFRGAVRFETAAFSAVAAQPAGFNAEMAEFPALCVVAGIGMPVDDDGTADAVFQREIREIGRSAPDKKLRKAAGGSIIFHVNGIRNTLGQHLQRHIPDTQRGGHMDPRMILGDQGGNGDPDAEELRAVDLMIVQKSFQQRRQRRGFFRERGDKIKRNHLIGEFMQAQIGQN